MSRAGGPGVVIEVDGCRRYTLIDRAAPSGWWGETHPPPTQQRAGNRVGERRKRRRIRPATTPRARPAVAGGDVIACICDACTRVIERGARILELVDMTPSVHTTRHYCPGCAPTEIDVASIIDGAEIRVRVTTR